MSAEGRRAMNPEWKNRYAVALDAAANAGRLAKKYFDATLKIEWTLRRQKQRGFGDFYGFLLVAQGSGEIMVEHGVHAWDVAAIKPIVEEAGGRFSDWDGTPSIHRPDVIVSNGKLHDEVLAILNSQTRDLWPRRAQF